VKCVEPGNILVNQTLFHLFRGIRTPLADEVMLNITLLGQKQVLLPIVMVVFFSLLFWKRPRAAFHTLVLGVLAAGSVFVLKNILYSPRPWGIFHSPETYSMPSGHAVLSTTLFMGFAFLIAQAFKRPYRWPLYTVAVLIAFLVALSRLYIGAHWFTDIITAWLLSAEILMIVIFSYRRYAETPTHTLGVFVISFISLCIAFGAYHHWKFNQLEINYTQLDWPKAEISMSEWWQKNDMLPAYRTSLFGFPSQQINIAWTGDLEQIRATLLKEGCGKPPPRDLVSTMHRISDIKSAQYLPMVSPQYLDKKPALILTRRTNNQKNLLVLRLWDANRTIKETDTKLWVGIISGVPRSYSWLFNKKTDTLTAIDPAWIFPNKVGIGEWQWKTTQSKQKILLIRENKSVHKKK
jgi:undecaprenyl-diphosphatase